jgi:hypothetical protein
MRKVLQILGAVFGALVLVPIVVTGEPERLSFAATTDEPFARGRRGRR